MAWYDTMITQAQSIVKRGEELVPMFFMSKNGKLEILSLGSVSHDKDIMSVMMRALVGAFDPDEYLFISESFARMLNPHDETEQAIGKLVIEGTLQVSQLPSSKEAIVALYGDRQSERVCMIPFTRKKGHVTFEKPKWLTEGKGRFMNLRGPER